MNDQSLIKDAAETNYWNRYYDSEHSKLVESIPSQFAVFALSEMLNSGIKQVYEFGCGNGRDTKFFLNNNVNVFATDKCIRAVTKRENLKKQHLEFKFCSLDIIESFEMKFGTPRHKKALYARFLLHALSQAQLEIFFQNSARFMTKSDMLFVEYRTLDDQHLPKVTDKHFRNFLSAESVKAVAMTNQLELIFEAEGLGFAKWGIDNAYVARQIFSKQI